MTRRVVKKKKQVDRSGRVVRTVAMVIILAAAGLTYVWSAGRVTALSYEIAELENGIAEAEELNRKLQVELASLTRADRLERVARTRLGLVRPQAERVIVLR